MNAEIQESEKSIGTLQIIRSSKNKPMGCWMATLILFTEPAMTKYIGNAAGLIFAKEE